LHEEIGALLGLPDRNQTLYQGWLSVESDAPGTSGLVTFAGVEGGAFLTSTPLAAAGGRRFVLPHVAMLDGYYTGLSLFNCSSSPAAVQIRAYDEMGILNKQAVVVIGAESREVGIIEQMLPGMTPQNRGYILLDADQDIVAMGVFGTIRLNVLAAIPAIPR
jgi:hypothetical protein